MKTPSYTERGSQALTFEFHEVMIDDGFAMDDPVPKEIKASLEHVQQKLLVWQTSRPPPVQCTP